MAVNTVTNRVAYQGDGTSAVFAFGYELHAQSDLAVFAFNSSLTTPGIIRAMALNGSGGFGYTFSGTANAGGVYPSGGNIICNSAPNAQTVMVLFRSSAVTADFLVNKFQPIPGDAVTHAIDKLTLIDQRAQDIGTRSVRLPDGFYGDFDTTLPENILQSAGKRLIVNSSANGWTFDETTASYIPNTLIVAATNSSVTSLGGSPDGRVILSRGSSAPEWGRVNLASSESVTGVLPVANGGTALSAINQFSLMYACTATQVGFIPDGTNGSLLTFNSGTFPTFQAFSAANINSGILSVAIGGTGTGTSYIDYGVVFASSATQLANTAAGGGDVPLLGNPGAAPGFRALPLNSASSVTGVLPVANGGTNISTLAAQGTLFASSATQVGVVDPGNAGQALTSNGAGAAPSYQNVAITTGVSIVNANYSATTSDTVILAQGSNYVITLYAPTAVNRVIEVMKDSNHIGVVTVAGSSTVGVFPGIGSSTTLNTYHESLRILVNSSGYRILERRIPQYVVNASNDVGASWGAGIINTVNWVRRGRYVEVVHNIVVGQIGTPGGLVLDLPPQMRIDSSILIANSGTFTAGGILGDGYAWNRGINNFEIAVNHYLPSGGNSVGIYRKTTAQSSVVAVASQLSNTSPFTFGSSDGIFVRYSYPVHGWNG